MARGRSGAGGEKWSTTRPQHANRFSRPVDRNPPPAPARSSSGGSMFGGMGSTIAEGMAFGSGSAIAHRAVDAAMGPRTIQHETVAASGAPTAAAPAPNMAGSDACSVQLKAFQDQVPDLHGYVE